MVEWRFRIEHLLEFAGEEERQRYLSPERTEAERNEIRSELEEVYQSIPDPTEAELKQFMGENTWRETEHNPSARELPKAQWKSFRKAEARAELEKRKAATKPVVEEWYSDDPNDVSLLTGRRRKYTALRVPPELLPKSKPKSESTDSSSDPKIPYPGSANAGEGANYREQPPYARRPVDRPPFPNPTKEWERRDRISRAIQSGGRPDPEDLAEEHAEEVRYQKNLAAAFERKRKELESEDSKAIVERPRPPIEVATEAVDELRKRSEHQAKEAIYGRELVNESSIASEPHFTVLEDSGPVSRLSRLLNKIPVWKEFGAWLKWASACFAFAATMTQLGEYGWALFGLILCGLCCLTQVAVWTASPSNYKNALAKIFLAALSIALIIVAALTLVKIKGEKPWSVWQASGAAASPTPATVGLFPSPPPSASTIPALSTPSPSPSPIATFPGTITPESAQFDLEGGKRYNVLNMFRLQENYRGPGSVLQFEVIVINSGELYAGGANVSDKTGLPIDQSRYWQQVDIRDLYFYMPHSGRVAITFVWLKPLVLTPSP